MKTPVAAVTQKHLEALTHLMKSKRFVAALEHKPRIIQSYDIPYLAGYSKDGETIYIDRHIPMNIAIDGVKHNILPFIVKHEVVEKSLMDIFGMNYKAAHMLATSAEHDLVRKAGIDVNSYEAVVKPYIKKAEHEVIKKVPMDLDITPYKDENDIKLLKKLVSPAVKKQKLVETKISLEYHSELNPKLWDGTRLKPEVQKKLVDFGYAWGDFAKIPRNLIHDIIMTGGNANYNYTPQSDIDVHLIINRNALGGNREFVDEYLQDKKVLWTVTHKITILGYTIEPYAQNEGDAYPANQGVYSLMKSEWIQFPNKGEYNWQDDPALKRKVMFYKKMIDNIIKNKMSEKVVKDLKTKLREMRNASIAKGGEFSFENLVFKELRNRGYLDKLNRYELSLKDKELSL